jgi:hypothetical protein
MTNNNKTFKLTYGTPLMNGSRLSKDIGLLANTPSAKQILDGTYNFPPGTDPHTIKLLKHIGEVARRIGHDPIDVKISTEDYKKYWNKRKEKTSSSFSTLHFGHWKAAASNSTLATIHAKMTEISFRTGSPLNRWTSGLSVMLEKIPGNISHDKLRAILLMEADFNFGNALLFGKRTVEAAVKHGVMSKEIFSRKNHCSIDTSMCRLMFFI